MFACCDESGIEKGSRHWVIGAMWLPDDACLPAYEATIVELRQETGLEGAATNLGHVPVVDIRRQFERVKPDSTRHLEHGIDDFILRVIRIASAAETRSSPLLRSRGFIGLAAHVGS